MTTITLKIADNRQDLVEAFKVFVSSISDVTFEISQEDTKEEVLSSLSKVCKDIKN